MLPLIATDDGDRRCETYDYVDRLRTIFDRSAAARHIDVVGERIPRRIDDEQSGRDAGGMLPDNKGKRYPSHGKRRAGKVIAFLTTAAHQHAKYQL